MSFVDGNVNNYGMRVMNGMNTNMNMPGMGMGNGINPVNNVMNATYPHPRDNLSKNKAYLNDLKLQMMEQNKHPNKIQQYKEKMIEREESDRNYYNPFGKGGSGAPMRDFNGNILTGRKMIENNLYKENLNTATNPMVMNYQMGMNQMSNYPEPMNPNYNQNLNSQMNMNYNPNTNPFLNPLNYVQNNIPNTNFYNTINKDEQMYAYNMNPYNNFQTNNGGLIMQTYRNSNPNMNMNMNIEMKPQNINQLMNYNQPNPTTTIQVPSNNKETNRNYNNPPTTSNRSKSSNIDNIIPKTNDPGKESIRDQHYKNDLLRQIEERKYKKEEEKRKEAELDRLEEERFKQYLQKKKEQEEQTKLKRKNKLNQNQEESVDHHLLNNPQQNNPNQYNPPNTTRQSPPQSNEVIIEKNTDMLYPRNRKFEEEMREKEEKELKQFKEQIGLTYENLNNTIKEDASQQIIRLKSEVSKQYGEISEIFNKLRNEVKEANQLKFDAERELNKIKDEIERRRVTSLLYEDKFNTVLEKHAPHNNSHIPIDEVNPIYMIKQKPGKGRHVNLKSTSTMVYGKEDFMDDKTDFVMGTAKTPNKYKVMSSLAQRGQNLVGESEFVPIVNPSRNFDKFRDIDSDFIPNNLGGNTNPNQNPNNYDNSPHMEESLVDMYSKLNEISNLNTKMDPTTKYKSIKTNFDVEIENKYNPHNNAINLNDITFPYDESLKLNNK